MPATKKPVRNIVDEIQQLVHEFELEHGTPVDAAPSWHPTIRKIKRLEKKLTKKS